MSRPRAAMIEFDQIPSRNEWRHDGRVHNEGDCKMLMAYYDVGYTIKDVPSEDTRVGANPISDLTEAEKILAWAKKTAPKVNWVLEGKGPWRVREK